MKHLIILLILTVSVITSCVNEPIEKPDQRFNLGDIAWLKPDSTKCVITYVEFNSLRYCWQYRIDYPGMSFKKALTTEYLFH